MKKFAVFLCVALLIAAIFTGVVSAKEPLAKAGAVFEGGNGKIDRFVRIFVDEGGYRQVLRGLKNTMLIAVFGLAIGIFLGTLIAAVRVMPKYKRLPRILNGICSVYVGFFRGTPIVVQLLLGYYVLLPALGLNYPALYVCIAVFGLNSGAYVSEIVRSGLMSVDPGQMEAGRSLGLNYFTTMRFIVIPQAIKNILPALGNEFITLLGSDTMVQKRLPQALQYANLQNILYFVGISLMFGALTETGLLAKLNRWILETGADSYVIGIVMSGLSAIFGNIATLIGGIDIFHVSERLTVPAEFACDGQFWYVLSFATTFGGSLLIGGTVSGILLMRMEGISAAWYIRHITPKVLAGLAVGMLLMWGTSFLF